MALSRMSFGLLSLKQLVINPCRRPISINCRLSGLFAMSVLHPVLPKSFIFPHNLPTSTTPKLYVPCRRSTVFSSYSGDMLWEGVTGPKGGSKRRARGKRRVTRQKIDLNKGQKIGIGKASIQWPGLNASMSNPLIKQGVYDKDYFERLENLRNKSAVKKKRMKLAPLQRGWTGNRLGGQSIGPPTPNYPDFDCCVIESKVVATMTATKGRYRRFSVVVATGNGQGLCGVGKARALTLQSAVRRAKLCASQNIVPFELKEGRTLWHDGYVCEWNSKIFATPLPEGAGLICHRMIKTLCQVIGIKDMYAKVDGSTTNYQAIARGFLRLLGQQKTYSELASSLGLHVVEFAADRNMYPHILASPVCGHTIDLNKTTMTGSNALNPRTTSKKQSGDLPLLAISNPIRHQPHKPKPDEHENFLDDLVDDYDRALEINISELLAAGERDLNALMVGGRVRHHKNANRFQFNGPAAVKRQAERYRYRNQKSVKRQSDAHAALCQPSSSV